VLDRAVDAESEVLISALRSISFRAAHHGVGEVLRRADLEAVVAGEVVACYFGIGVGSRVVARPLLDLEQGGHGVGFVGAGLVSQRPVLARDLLGRGGSL
jgi:hypothetical protein